MNAADGQLSGASERSAGRDGASISGVIPRVFRSAGSAPSTINEAAARAADGAVMIPEPALTRQPAEAGNFEIHSDDRRAVRDEAAKACPAVLDVPDLQCRCAHHAIGRQRDFELVRCDVAGSEGGLIAGRCQQPRAFGLQVERLVRIDQTRPVRDVDAVRGFEDDRGSPKRNESDGSSAGQRSDLLRPGARRVYDYARAMAGVTRADFPDAADRTQVVTAARVASSPPRARKPARYPSSKPATSM